MPPELALTPPADSAAAASVQTSEELPQPKANPLPLPLPLPPSPPHTEKVATTPIPAAKQADPASYAAKPHTKGEPTSSINQPLALVLKLASRPTHPPNTKIASQFWLSNRRHLNDYLYHCVRNFDLPMRLNHRWNFSIKYETQFKSTWTKPYKLGKVYAKKIGSKLSLKRANGKTPAEQRAATSSKSESESVVVVGMGSCEPTTKSTSDAAGSEASKSVVSNLDSITDVPTGLSDQPSSGGGCRSSRAYKARKQFNTVSQKTQKFFRSLVHTHI